MLESVYLVLLFLIAFIEIVRKKADNNKFDFLTLFHLYFFLLYPLPGFLLAFDYENAVSDIGLGISLSSKNIQTALAIFTGYFIVLKAFYSKSAQTLGNSFIIRERGNNLFVFYYAILLLLFSCLSIYIYSSQFGGVLQTIATTTARRSVAIKGGILVFFGRLTLFSVLASYLLGAFIFIKKQKKVTFITYIILKYFIFIVAVSVAVMAILITGGRAYVINYFGAFYLFYLIKAKRVPLSFLSIFVCLAVLFLFYGKHLFFSLTALPDGYTAVIDRFSESVATGSNENFNFYSFVYNFQYPVYSLDAAFTKDYQMRWFVDFIYGFLSLIPNRLLGTEELNSIVYYNSVHIIGHNDYAIPTGFLAFAVYSMWWPGLIIVCFTYGWIGRYLQTILLKHIKDIFWMPVLYVVTAQMWMDFLGSDPETFLQSYFCYLTGCFLLLFIGSKISVDRHGKV